MRLVDKLSFKYFLLKLDEYGFLRFNDSFFLRLKFYCYFHRSLNLKNPKTFNEKLQWLKLHDKKDLYTTMVDKFDVKKYVSNLIGNDYIIPTLGVFDCFDDINFDILPNQFVMKCTHDSGGIVIVKDKSHFNINDAKRIINKSLNNNYFLSGREWPYKNVKPRIIIESYMEDSKYHELRDYKFFCFNGTVKCFKIDFNRSSFHQANYFDRNGKLMRFGESVCPPDFNKDLSLPSQLCKMIDLAEILSKNIPFLRVDFYEVDNKILFGELTFYPASGFGKFTDDKWDNILGSWIELPLDGDCNEK